MIHFKSQKYKLYIQIRVAYFCNVFYVLPSQQNNPNFTLRKWKIIFLCIENENFQHEVCLPSQHAHMWPIWGHFKKLYHGLGHNLANVAWKPRNFIQDRSFCDGFSRIFASNEMKFGTWVLLGMGNDATMDSFQFGYKISVFRCPDHQMRWITHCGHDPCVLGFRFCKTLCGSMIKWHVVYSKMIFPKNHEQAMVEL